ncbi:alpha/beta hydrolase [Paenibacillus flagellatus]|uniref:Esterase family protein n=1 Tax=Paenibacillus flagellatus TaxID=2211139 RepID=A0A2V5JTX8_9BACL|nr:alpha/beta hydrolase family protein [Paenibacillus flagellatus]PYI50025.1 esterase family protein [Paenibacillus flagellatus]
MTVRPVPFFSGALYARKSCFVYLPPSYEQQPDRSYPVVYLLHGMYGSESSWLQNGQAEQTLDRLIATGELRECIVVMPNDGGYGHGTFYLDWYDGSGNYEQYLLYDLLPFIDANFRTIPDRVFRMVGGLSMGGFGAFSLALRHPDVFGAAASLSGALGSASKLPYRDFSRSEWARMIGPQQGDYAKAHDLSLLSARRCQDALRPSLYFDCGRDDYLFALNEQFKRHLDEIGYPYRYAEYDGQHNWEYWTEHLPDMLRFFESCWSEVAPVG